MARSIFTGYTPEDIETEESAQLSPEIKATFEDAARRYGVPVNVLRGIAERESAYRPMARRGEGRGIMGLDAGTFAAGGPNPYDPKASIETEAKNLKAALEKGMTIKDAVKARYSGDQAATNDALQRALRIADAEFALPKAPAPAAAPVITDPERAAMAQGAGMALGGSPEAGSAALDVAGTLGGGAIKGTGAAIRGAGKVVQAGEDLVDAMTSRERGRVESLGAKAYETGDPADVAAYREAKAKYEENNPGAPNRLTGFADIAKQWGEALQNALVSAQGKAAMENSQISGSVFDPGNIDFGKDPSVYGYLLNGLDVFGQMAPILAAQAVTGSAGATAIGGLQGSGAADEQARAMVQQAYEDGTLAKQSPMFAGLIAKGVDEKTALARTLESASDWSSWLTLPISALGGYATGKLFDPATKLFRTGGVVTRATGRAALGFVEEGTQEVGESLATQAGVDIGTGLPVEYGEGTAADFIMGGFAGSVPGAIGGALSEREAKKPRTPKEALLDELRRFNEAKLAPLPADTGLRRTGTPYVDAEPADAGGGDVPPAPPETPQETAPDAAIEPENVPEDARPPADIEALRREAAAMPDGPARRDAMQAIADLERAQGIEPERAIVAPDAPRFRRGERVRMSIGDNEMPATFTVERDDENGVLLVDERGEEIEITRDEIAENDLRLVPFQATPEAAPPPRGRITAPEPTTVEEAEKRLEYIREQGRTNGWSPKLVKDRKAAEAAVARLKERQNDLPAVDDGTAGPVVAGKDAADRPLPGAADEGVPEGAGGEARPVEGAAAPSGDRPGDVSGSGRSADTKPALTPARGSARLPEGLRGAKPRYGYKSRNFTLDFEDDIDRAAFIAAQPKPSKRDAEYVEWAAKAAGMSPEQVRRHGATIREALKQHAKGAPAGSDLITVPRMARAGFTPVDEAAHEAATSPTNDRAEPTEAQKEAGNYKVGRISLGGLDISIENPAGSTRSGTDKGGKAWSITMQSHYGYIRGTKGKDKDHIDVFVKPGTRNEDLRDGSPVFIVNQIDPSTGQFDEHKVLIGFEGRTEAWDAYHANYADDWKGGGRFQDFDSMTLAGFKEWLADADTTKPTRAPKADKAAESRKRGAEAADRANAKADADTDAFVATKLKAAKDDLDTLMGGGRIADPTKTVASLRKEIAELEGRKKPAQPENPTKSEPKPPKEKREPDARDLAAQAFRNLKKSDKAFKALTGADTVFDPHPESGPASDMVEGWNDAKAGRPLDEAKTHRMMPADNRTNVFNPIDSYRSAYFSYLLGKPIRVSAHDTDPDISPVPDSDAMIADAVRRAINGARPDSVEELRKAIGTSHMAFSGDRWMARFDAGALTITLPGPNGEPVKRNLSAKQVLAIAKGLGADRAPKAEKLDEREAEKPAAPAADAVPKSAARHGIEKVERPEGFKVRHFFETENGDRYFQYGTSARRHTKGDNGWEVSDYKATNTLVFVDPKDVEALKIVNALDGERRMLVFRVEDNQPIVGVRYFTGPNTSLPGGVAPSTIKPVTLDPREGRVPVIYNENGAEFGAPIKYISAPLVGRGVVEERQGDVHRPRTIPRETYFDRSGNAFDLGINSLDLGDRPGDAARDILLDRTRENEVEYSIAIDQHGDVVENNSGEPTSCLMTGRFKRMMLDGNEQIVLHHTHPKPYGFSPADFTIGALPGIAAVYAHTVDEAAVSYRHEWTPAGKRAMRQWIGPDVSTDRAFTAIRSQIQARFDGLTKALQRAGKAEAGGEVTEAIALRVNTTWAHMMGRALADAGLIWYEHNDTRAPDPFSVLSDVRSAYNETVEAFRSLIEPRGRAAAAGDAGAGRYAGDLARIPGRDEGTAAEPDREDRAGGHDQAAPEGRLPVRPDTAAEAGGKASKGETKRKTVVTGDGGHLTVKLTKAGPWDFNDTYPASAKDMAVEEVVEIAEDILADLQVLALDRSDAEADLDRLMEGGKAPLRGREKPRTITELRADITRIEEAKAALVARATEVFGDQRIPAFTKEADERAKRELAQRDRNAAPRPAPEIRDKLQPTVSPKTSTVAPVDVGPSYPRGNALVVFNKRLSGTRKIGEEIVPGATYYGSDIGPVVADEDYEVLTHGVIKRVSTGDEVGIAAPEYADVKGYLKSGRGNGDTRGPQVGEIVRFERALPGGRIRLRPTSDRFSAGFTISHAEWEGAEGALYLDGEPKGGRANGVPMEKAPKRTATKEERSAASGAKARAVSELAALADQAKKIGLTRPRNEIDEAEMRGLLRASTGVKSDLGFMDGWRDGLRGEIEKSQDDVVNALDGDRYGDWGRLSPEAKAQRIADYMPSYAKGFAAGKRHATKFEGAPPVVEYGLRLSDGLVHTRLKISNHEKALRAVGASVAKLPVDRFLAPVAKLAESEIRLAVVQGPETVLDLTDEAVTSLFERPGDLAGWGEIESAPRMTPAETDTLLRRGQLGKALGALIDAGILVIVPDASAIGAPKGVSGRDIRGAAFKDRRIAVVTPPVDQADQLLPTVLHEAFHAGVRPLVSDRVFKQTLRRIEEIVGRAVERVRKGDPKPSDVFWKEAFDSVRARYADSAQHVEETAAYAIQRAELGPSGWRETVDRLMGAVKAWALRFFGAQLGEVTPEQLRALAAAAVKAGWSRMTGSPDEAIRLTRPNPADLSSSRSDMPHLGASTVDREGAEPQYSIDPGFEPAVDAIAGGAETDKPILVGRTPEVLKALGVPDAPVAITANVIWKAIDKHGLTPTKIKAIVKGIERPVAVFDSRTEPNAYVLLTEAPSREGASVVAIHINKVVLRRTGHIVASIHSARAEKIPAWMRDGLLRYIDNEKAAAWAGSTGLQLPKESQITRRPGASLLRPDDVFKEKAAAPSGSTGLRLPKEGTAQQPAGDVTQHSAGFKNDDENGGNPGETPSLSVSEPDLAASELAGLSRHGTFASTRALTDHLRSSPHWALMADLIRTGRVMLHNSVADLPARPDGKPYPAMTAAGTTRGGTLHFIASALKPETVEGVVLHEIFHSKVLGLVGDKTWQRLMARMEGILASAIQRELSGEQVPSSRWWNTALRRIPISTTPRSMWAEELAAYAIENRANAPLGVAEIIDNLLGRLKAWALRTFGVQIGALTPGQLKALAVAAFRGGRSTAKRPIAVLDRLSPARLSESKKGSDGGAQLEMLSVAAEDPPTGQTLKAWLKEQVSARTTQAMPAFLGTVPLRPLLTEVARDMPAAKEYARIQVAMGAMRDDWHARTDDVAQRWLKFKVFDKTENAKLMDLMHETTIAEVDPSKPFKSFVTEKDTEVMKKGKPGQIGFEIAANKIKTDAKRRSAYERLKLIWAELSDEAKAIYGDVRDTYSALADEQEAIILANMTRAVEAGWKEAQREHAKTLRRIKEQGLTGKARADAIAEADAKLADERTLNRWRRRARITRMREQFESNRVKGPYFPLARFGQFYVTVRDNKGEMVSFSRFEKVLDQERFAKEIQAENPTYNVYKGVLGNPDSRRQAVSSEFVADIEDILTDAGIDKSTKDQVWQRYLETLPDLSIRKARIHRTGRAGFSADAIRAFGSHMFHGAHQTARLKYAMELTEQLEAIDIQARESADPVRNGLIHNEIEKRHEFIMNPTGGALAQAITSFGFIYHLSVSPAAAIVNISQTVIMGTPILAAYDGRPAGQAMAAAAKELGRALRDFTHGKGKAETSSRLTEDEKAAMRSAYEIGLIERTQSHDLAGVGETGVEYSPVRQRVMGAISWFFHHAERLNREVTFLAAYRLARAKGRDHGIAIEDAADLTWKSHFDYQNTSRPRFMQGNTAKVFLLFRNFQANMLFRLFRDVRMACISKEDRREALMQIGAITGMMMFSAGVRGTWIVGNIVLLAWLFFGDDDKDPETWLRKGLTDLLPSWIAGPLLDGVPGYFLGVDLSTRIGMPNLLWQSPDQQLEGRDLYLHYLEQAAGPALAPIANLFRGWSMASEGHVYRGVETVAPKFVKDLMRSYRFATEGVVTLKGDDVVESLSPLQVIAQAIGFTPAEVAERYRLNSGMKQREIKIIDRRGLLMARYDRAIRDENDAALQDVLGEIEAFNEAYPEYPITGKSLRQSMRSRQRARDNNVGGIGLNPKLDERIRSEAPEPVYD